MKKKLPLFILTALLSFAAAPAAYAQPYNYSSADMYVVVSAPDNYVNARFGPGMEYENNFPIYNGERLHVFETADNSEDGLWWGHTEYGGESVWISLSQTTVISNQAGQPAAGDSGPAASDRSGVLGQAASDRSSAPAVITRTLEKGMSGEDVRQVQEMLIQLGYLDGAADGEFGDMTQAAVVAFQKASGLQFADGVVGAGTLLLLDYQAHQNNSAGAAGTNAAGATAADTWAGAYAEHLKGLKLANIDRKYTYIREELIESEGKIISFYDFTGDGIPEMVYYCFNTSPMAQGMNNFRIVTFRDGEVADLFGFRPGADFMGTGGGQIFTAGSSVYIVSSYNANVDTYQEKTDNVREYEYVNDEFELVNSYLYSESDSRNTYRINDADSDPGQVADAVRAATEKAEILVASYEYLYDLEGITAYYPEDIKLSAITSYSSGADRFLGMSYYEALKYLSEAGTYSGQSQAGGGRAK